MNDLNLTKKQRLATLLARTILKYGHLSYLPRSLIILLLLSLSVSWVLAQGPGTITVVDTAKIGYISSLLLTSEGLPVISYNDSTDFWNNYSKIAFCHNLACTSKRVVAVNDDPGISDTIDAMQLKAGNLPVILYTGFPNPGLIVCHDPTCNSFINNSDIFELPGRDYYHRGTLALTPAGIPVIAFTEMSTYRVYLARCSDPTCSTPPPLRAIERTNSRPFKLSLRLTRDNRPLISYIDYEPGLGGGDFVRLVVCQDPNCANFTLTEVDKEDSLGLDVSLQLNSAGIPVISYVDVENDALKVALCDTLTCNNPQIKTLASGFEEVAFDQSMALTRDDRPILSYETGYPDYDLKLAVCGDPQCNEVTTTLLDSKDETGLYNTLVLTADDLPVIAYNNNLQEDLQLYTFNLSNARLNFNHFRGGPDSVFTLNGSGFPANAPVAITINGVLINTNLTSNASGNFTFLLDTAGADLGYYSVRVKAVTPLGFSVERHANFLIETTAPKRGTGGPGPTVNVPAGIGLPPRFVQFPLLVK